jgi:membrane-bound lytic murein transglycosylase D
VGVWQFTRPTGRQFLHIGHAADERLDPVASARGAARYFRKAHDLLESWPLALTSYNYGIAGMVRARARFGHDFEAILESHDGSTFGFASRNFYAEFLAAREIAREPARFFPEGIGAEQPLGVDQVLLPRPMRSPDVAARYDVPLPELRRLNPAWTARGGSGAVPLPSGLMVWLPSGTLARHGRPAEAAPRPPSSERASIRYHKVRLGDTLWSVAQRYGLGLPELRRLNGMSARTQTIRVGQRLKVG